MIITYCTSPEEQQSARVAQILRQRGFKTVRILKGGLGGWTNARLPVEGKSALPSVGLELYKNLSLGDIERRRFKQGEVIFKEGAEAQDEAFVIHAGTVEIRRNFDGVERVVNRIGEGEPLGEMAVFRGERGARRAPSRPRTSSCWSSRKSASSGWSAIGLSSRSSFSSASRIWSSPPTRSALRRTRAASDDAALAQPGQLGARDPQPAAVDLLVVLARPGRPGALDPSRRQGEPRHHARHRDPAEEREHGGHDVLCARTCASSNRSRTLATSDEGTSAASSAASASARRARRPSRRRARPRGRGARVARVSSSSADRPRGRGAPSPDSIARTSGRWCRRSRPSARRGFDSGCAGPRSPSPSRCAPARGPCRRRRRSRRRARAAPARRGRDRRPGPRRCARRGGAPRARRQRRTRRPGSRGPWASPARPARDRDSPRGTRAADRGGDPPEAGTLAVRPGLPERRDAHHDERRPEPREVVPAEIPPLERSGTEVLGDDVGGRDQPANQRLTFRISQVARDRLLVARLDEPPVGAAGRRRDGPAQAPQVVADARLLHLDHVGAELAQERRADGRGQIGREIEDGDAGEGVAGLGHGGILPRSCYDSAGSA